MALARISPTAITPRDNTARTAYQAAMAAVARAPLSPEQCAARQRALLELARSRTAQRRIGRKLGAQAARTRGVAIYLAAINWNVPARALARVAGLSERQVRRTLHAIEDARDHASIDQALDTLQGRLIA
jgi:hypothetical protein